ncbi:acetolactate decarboxylase [Oenococcus sicerae]|uniref:acetolactate decarboxylase n=1 Tax=Oenococcus sicerae TaxID=2203724 RepID=UPI0010B82922|nr:Alpha-acetolactate decarboxylase [Oenococcus sicerae]
MAEDIRKLYQHGILAQIMDGQYDGTMRLKELLNHGNFGIGTTTGIGVELIILDGFAYGIPGSGKVRSLNAQTEEVPFATINYFDNELPSERLKQTNAADFEKLVSEKYELQNVFAAIKVHGEFTNVLARSADQQQKPYPPFSKVAAAQHEFQADHLEATIVGYYSPSVYEGAAAAGFHLHILSDDHHFGGHLLDFTIDKADLQVQIFDNFELNLPTKNKIFRSRELDLSTLKAAIRKTE